MCHELPPSSEKDPLSKPTLPWWLNRVLHTCSRPGHSLKPKEGQCLPEATRVSG